MRAEEIVHSTNIFAVQNRFHPFFCDFAFTGFPKWLVCDSCVESFSLEQQEYSSGWYFFLVCFFILDYCNHRYISIWVILLTSSDVKEGGVADKSGSYLSRECGCCIGGVDFVSLVCFLFCYLCFLLLLTSIRPTL